ncbi:hypothetical protein B0H14DRAFT_2873477, partial [Mycena olivaceomarginata]
TTEAVESDNHEGPSALAAHEGRPSRAHAPPTSESFLPSLSLSPSPYESRRPPRCHGSDNGYGCPRPEEYDTKKTAEPRLGRTMRTWSGRCAPRAPRNGHSTSSSPRRQRVRYGEHWSTPMSSLHPFAPTPGPGGRGTRFRFSPLLPLLLSVLHSRGSDAADDVRGDVEALICQKDRDWRATLPSRKGRGASRGEVRAATRAGDAQGGRGGCGASETSGVGEHERWGRRQEAIRGLRGG